MQENFDCKIRIKFPRKKDQATTWGELRDFILKPDDAQKVFDELHKSRKCELQKPGGKIKIWLEDGERILFFSSGMFKGLR